MEWCREHDLDFTTYYYWERKILIFMIPMEDVRALPSSDLPAIVPASRNAIVKVKLVPKAEEQDTVRFSLNGYGFSIPSNVSSTFLAQLLKAAKYIG